jgi:hypothetical protein
MKNIKYILILIIPLFIFGCNKKIVIPETKEVRVYWGKKEEIKLFLDSPSAKAERWLVEALGE